MTQTPIAPTPGARLSWLDTMKGIAILWIVFFHAFAAYEQGRYPAPFKVDTFLSFVSDCASDSWWRGVGCTLQAALVALIQQGPGAVGIFIVLSGFGLTYSLVRRGGPGRGWPDWYRRRVVRLFPMYWLAHVIVLVSPFAYRQDSVDVRFLLSFLGDRVVPVDQVFFYLVPAWWYFGLLLELYLVFPLLFRLLQRLGPLLFLIAACLFTVGSRYLFFGLLQASGNYVMGAFFGCRLWEFAVGMVVAVFYARQPGATEEGLFSGKVLLAGIVLYGLGRLSYEPTFTYAFSDGLAGTGLFIVLGHVCRWIDHIPHLRARLALTGAYSYGIYLLHQPYVMTLGHWAQGLGMFSFMVLASLVAVLIVLGSIPLERLTNRLASRLLDRPKAA